MEKEYAGIDVSKDTLDIATYTSNKRWRFTNNDTGISRLIKALEETGLALVVMEATGGYETRLAYALHKAEIPCAVINPHRCNLCAAS
jgi:transposase